MNDKCKAEGERLAKYSFIHNLHNLAFLNEHEVLVQ
jgi:hypothetical protein